ncbi:hypothetical protein V5H41_28560, partial [Salmonella enterica]
LTEQQAQAILDLRLQKLTGLEHENCSTKYKELLEQIAELLHILGSADRLTEQQAQAILDLRLQKLTGLEHENCSTKYKELL